MIRNKLLCAVLNDGGNIIPAMRLQIHVSLTLAYPWSRHKAATILIFKKKKKIKKKFPSHKIKTVQEHARTEEGGERGHGMCASSGSPSETMKPCVQV